MDNEKTDLVQNVDQETNKWIKGIHDYLYTQDKKLREQGKEIDPEIIENILKGIQAKVNPDNFVSVDKFNEYTMLAAKDKAALRYGLSEDDLQFVHGTTVEDILENARKLSERLKKEETVKEDKEIKVEEKVKPELPEYKNINSDVPANMRFLNRKQG